MIWLLSIVSQLTFGTIISMFISPIDSDAFTLFGIGIPIGFSVSLFSYLIMSIIIGHNLFNIILNTMILASSSVVLVVLSDKRRFINIIRHTKMIHFVYSIPYFALPFIIFNLAYFHQPNMLPFSMNQFIHEDLAITASFHIGCNSVSLNPFSFKNPNYYGEKLTERWISGFHSAILRTAHAGNEISLIIPMSLLSYSFAILMRFVGLKFRLPELALATAPFLVFSLAGYSFFDFEKTSRMNRQELDYVYNAPHGKTTYLHPHLGVLFSCRSVLYASTASLLIFAFLLNRTSEIGQLLIFCCAGFLISSSIKPCFILLILFFLLYFIFTPKEFPLRAFLAFLAGSVLNISRLSFTIINKTQWNDLTLKGVFFPSCIYWYNTLGFFVPFAVLGVMFTKQIEGRITKCLLILFIFAANTSFYENLTTNIYTYYGLFMPMAVLSYLIFFNRFANFFEEEETKGIIGAVATLIAGAGCFSSVIGTSKMMKISETVYSQDQINIYSVLLNTTKYNDIIFTTNSSLDVASTMLGRQVVRYSQDFMKLFGIEPKYQKEISEFFFQPTGYNRFLKFVDCFLIHASDAEKYHFNVPQGNPLKNIYNISDVMIYKRNK